MCGCTVAFVTPIGAGCERRFDATAGHAVIPITASHIRLHGCVVSAPIAGRSAVVPKIGNEGLRGIDAMIVRQFFIALHERARIRRPIEPAIAAGARISVAVIPDERTF